MWIVNGLTDERSIGQADRQAGRQTGRQLLYEIINIEFSAGRGRGPEETYRITDDHG